MDEPEQPSKTKEPTVVLGEPFFRALRYANDLHATDTRKGRDIPYVSHLLAVASLVLEHGGDEDLAIAALLHDTVEDHPDVTTFQLIGEMFGTRVAKVVRGCSDTESAVKEDWCLRKTRYLAHLRDESDDDTLTVSFADKLHNAHSILADVRRDGPEYLDRFSAKRRGTLWYYRSLVEIFHGRGRDVTELERVVLELEEILGDRVEGDCPEL